MLTPGTRLGAYELISLLGAGGMGEVYRARDTKLNRDVAVKVLPESFASDRESLARFEREAHAVAALNHPNILSIFDFGTHEGTVFAVMELLEGQTLRDKLDAGPFAQRRAVEVAIQIARGLAAAHEKGVVHRDLKPENLFLTEDGRVKILDFGLAKKFGPASAETNAPTTPAGTEPGTVMGTVGYMSPEQVRGRDVDARTDIFSFGAVFYEMLTGTRAFRRDSPVETMSAILKEEPPELAETARGISPSLERIVRHCLEKSPAARFQSAGDVAFDLEALSGTSQSQAALSARSPRFRWKWIAAVAAVPILVGAGLAVGRRGSRSGSLTFQQLTFQRGTIISARFAPDGNTLIYGAAWTGRPFETFTIRADSQFSRPLGFPGDILSISPSGELALSLGRHFISSFNTSGTLAEVSLSGGAPHEVLEGIEWAEWGPDGKSLAVVRRVGGNDRLEYPTGTLIFQTAGWVGHPRVSPGGDRIAFLEHPSPYGDPGDVVMLELGGKQLARSTNWSSVQGLCWSSDRREVWFTGTRAGGNRRLWALDSSGRERLLASAPGILTIHDAQRDRTLLSHDSARLGMVGQMAGADSERDLSYLDWSAARDLSADGRLLLFDENSEGGGPTGSIFVLRSGEAAPVRLGDGYSLGLSPDGKMALTIPFSLTANRFILMPTGIGESVSLPPFQGNLLGADWTSDGKAILFGASVNGRPSRLNLQEIATGKIRPVSEEGVSLLLYAHLISPDSRFVIARGADREIRLYPLAGGSPKPLIGILPGEQPLRWSADGGSLFVYVPGTLPARVDRVRLSDGRREKWKDLVPGDTAGVAFLRAPLITPDGRSYVYSYTRILSELFLVRGIR
jgi:serine/threonine protein kinase